MRVLIHLVLWKDFLPLRFFSVHLYLHVGSWLLSWMAISTLLVCHEIFYPKILCNTKILQLNPLPPNRGCKFFHLLEISNLLVVRELIKLMKVKIMTFSLEEAIRLRFFFIGKESTQNAYTFSFI